MSLVTIYQFFQGCPLRHAPVFSVLGFWVKAEEAMWLVAITIVTAGR